MKRIVAVAVVASAAFAGMGSPARADDTLFVVTVDAETSAGGQTVETTATVSSYREGDVWHAYEVELDGPGHTTGGMTVICNAGITAGATCTVLDTLADLT